MSQYLLRIPEPCQESWEKMETGEGGKFCQQCSKNIIDFTTMSDEQVVRVLQNNKSGLCGRFANQQLNRFLGTPTKPTSKNWMSMLAGLALMSQSEKANASNKTIINNHPTVLGEKSLETTVSISKNLSTCDTTAVTVSGKVVDDKGEGVGFASVIIKGTNRGVQCDAEGRFQLKITWHVDTLWLVASAVGFETANISVVSLDQEPLKEDLIIMLTLREMTVTVGAVVTVRRKKLRKWWQFWERRYDYE